jgi:hypothetical protein
MSIQHGNRGIVKKDLQLYYNREFIKSFRGEATTNIVSNTTDFSGLSYAGYSTEWTSDPTRFTKTYNSNLQTPIGTGATLLIESGTAGYHHLSRLGGGGTGGHSISCYVYPVNGSITNFTIGMLGDGGSTAIFNLVTGTVVSTGVRVSNAFITKVSGWLGWYRVGANIGGREGGWVGAVGLDVQTSYTPSLPYKSMYVTGLQYEDTKTYCTPFVNGSRTANTIAGGGGLLDISGNNVNADLTNVSFNSSGYTFGGSANYIDLPASTFLDFNLNNFSIFTWINSSATANFGNIFNNMNAAGTLGVQFLTQPNNGGCRVWIGDLLHNNTVNVTNGSWNYIGFVRDGDYVYFYVNGSLSSTGTGFAAKNATPNSGNDRRIGRQTTNTAYDFNGQISNFKIYSRLLTAAEVLQNFNATRKTYGI